MLVAKIDRIRFERDDYVQTVAYQKAGLKLSEQSPNMIKYVIAENVEQAVKMLRKNFQEYLMKSTILNDESGFKYFYFNVMVSQIEDNRFYANFREITNGYKLIGDVE